MSFTLQHHQYNASATVKLLLDNLEDLLDTKCSQDEEKDGEKDKKGSRVELFAKKLGPGWKIAFIKRKETNPEDTHLLLMFGVEQPQPEPLFFQVVVESRRGVHYYSRSFEKLFILPGQSSGWVFMSKRFYLAGPALLRHENAVVLIVTVQMPPGPSPHSEPSISVLHRGITGEDSGQTVAFTTFTSRSNSGILRSPRTLFADNVILNQFCNGWDNSAMVCKSEHSRDNVATCATDYTDDDSDFDEESCNGDETEVGSGMHRASCSTRNFVRAHDGSPADQAAGHIPISPPMSALERTFSVSDDMEIDSATTTDIGSDIVKDTKITLDKPSPTMVEVACQTIPHSHPKSFIVVGAASVTWEALLFYLYSGKVAFAPLTSQGNGIRKEYVETYRRTNPQMAPPCSCKSMYRLADQLKLNELKVLALRHLDSQLSMDTILSEILSQFTSRHKNVQELEIEALKKYWDELVDTPALKDKLIGMVRGNYPHAVEMLSEIFQRLTFSDTTL